MRFIVLVFNMGERDVNKMKPDMQQVVLWVEEAWDEVSPVTIQNCWRHANILPAATIAFPAKPPQLKRRRNEAEQLQQRAHGMVGAMHAAAADPDSQAAAEDRGRAGEATADEVAAGAERVQLAEQELHQELAVLRMIRNLGPVAALAEIDRRDAADRAAGKELPASTEVESGLRQHVGALSSLDLAGCDVEQLLQQINARTAQRLLAAEAEQAAQHSSDDGSPAAWAAMGGGSGRRTAAPAAAAAAGAAAAAQGTAASGSGEDDEATAADSGGEHEAGAAETGANGAGRGSSRGQGNHEYSVNCQKCPEINGLRHHCPFWQYEVCVS